MTKLKHYTILGTIFVILAGTLAHFIYEWSGKNFIVGLVFPVSESTWEHMKLCFFPMLLYSLYMNRKLKRDYPCITSALLAGTLFGTFLIPVIFYTYTGILGHNFLVLDIATFILSVLLAFAAVYRLSTSCRLNSVSGLLKLLVFAIMICFFLFSYCSPDIGIFTDPVNK